MNYNIYQAKRMREEGDGLPSIKEIVKEKLMNSDVELKKEQIDEQVCLIIKLSKDESISGATSTALRELESEGSIDHISHGYWKRTSI
ncbi:hypothetical protein [Vallitalea guaymasensis]|uniref:Uncharacterized protein n=1 Tax=Vallitalea guaymasensis TaxID=1185412 RepID=A0A8J8MB17_9FIRM|nr:hypothetical protein [Vallitalea guaymasensis]QUH29613.1 hypothetical protein HYG85_12135 [Vallitalea guaymasensis]